MTKVLPIFIIIFDPTGLVHKYYNYKLAGIVGKFITLLLKFIFPIYIKTIFDKTIRKINIWKQWYIRKDIRIIKKLQKKTKELDIDTRINSILDYINIQNNIDISADIMVLGSKNQGSSPFKRSSKSKKEYTIYSL